MIGKNALENSIRKRATASSLFKTNPRTEPWQKNGGPSESLHERIQEKAYELYEQRGRVGGYDLEDWLKAERLVKAGRA